MLEKAQEEKATKNNRDGAKLSFQEKMKLFATDSNGGVREKAKISKAQRDIDSDENSEHVSQA